MIAKLALEPVRPCLDVALFVLDSFGFHLVVCVISCGLSRILVADFTQSFRSCLGDCINCSLQSRSDPVLMLALLAVCTPFDPIWIFELRASYSLSSCLDDCFVGFELFLTQYGCLLCWL